MSILNFGAKATLPRFLSYQHRTDSMAVRLNMRAHVLRHAKGAEAGKKMPASAP